VNFFLMVSCGVALTNCHPQKAPEGALLGQPLAIHYNTLEKCESIAHVAEKEVREKHLSKYPVRYICAAISINSHGGWDATDADGGASLWVPVIAASDAAASAGDGPPNGLMFPIAFENNSACLAALPKTESGKMYPVCAKVQLWGVPQR